MVAQELFLSKRYATAFLSLYDKKITPAVLHSLQDLLVFLEGRRPTFVLLVCPTLDIQQKIALLEKGLEKYHLADVIMPIATLLLQHKRIELAVPVLEQIVRLHHKMHGIVPVVIQTSHSITRQEQEQLSIFAQSLCKARSINPTFVVQKELISGIRIKSENVLWERSLANVLDSIKQTLLGLAQS